MNFLWFVSEVFLWRFKKTRWILDTHGNRIGIGRFSLLVGCLWKLMFEFICFKLV